MDSSAVNMRHGTGRKSRVECMRWRACAQPNFSTPAELEMSKLMHNAPGLSAVESTMYSVYRSGPNSSVFNTANITSDVANGF